MAENSTDCQLNSVSQEEQMRDLYQNFGQYCVVCGNVSSETLQPELNQFLSKFGNIKKIWLEEPNGKELRQALVFFSSKEELEKVIIESFDKDFKGYHLIIEKCSIELRKTSEILFNLLFEKNLSDQKKTAENLREEGIIKQIGDKLKQINTERKEAKDQDIKDHNWPTLSENDLLLTKFIFRIIHQLIILTPYIVKQIEQIHILEEMIKFLGTIPVHSVNDSFTLSLAVLLEKVSDWHKPNLLKNNGLQILSQILTHSNLDVKSNAIRSMFNILKQKERNKNWGKEFPQYEQIKNDDVLNQINQICLHNVKSEKVKIEAAIVLGQLLRAQEIEPKFRKVLIRQLKTGLQRENNLKYTEDLLNVFCGLAVNKHP
ncbi:MAG: hypothetical protein EZS28_010131 [Streblomastix strix]|uniref:RRM domain-containing protein n=1 Tax=Streblomastix strix TaxID=222440 RepID=A0A5J4WI47_9EUKA|nr:MAG: hypothetical protein EZS28_010131 [Streblomastix strix]